jgi:hypothetical protein
MLKLERRTSNVEPVRIVRMSAPGLPLQLTVPSEPRFRTIAVAMAQKVAESLGFSASDAAALGQELAAEAGAAARDGGGGEGASLQVRFEAAGQSLQVRANCGGVSFAISRPLPRA